MIEMLLQRGFSPIGSGIITLEKALSEHPAILDLTENILLIRSCSNGSPVICRS